VVFHVLDDVFVDVYVLLLSVSLRDDHFSVRRASLKLGLNVHNG